MIKLYKFGALDGVCDASPFCVKVEAYLKLSGLAYETQDGALNLRTAPKGKLPYIQDNGNTIADSGFILAYLKNSYGDTVDAHLNDRDKAIAHAFIKMIDENLYWTLVHARWKLDHNWVLLQKTFFGAIPFPLSKMIACKARGDILKALYKQGMGRHSDDEIAEIGNRDLKALSDFLADNPYFFGGRPSSLDAAVYGMLAQMILARTFSAPLFEQAKSYKNLVEFTGRFHTNYFHG